MIKDMAESISKITDRSVQKAMRENRIKTVSLLLWSQSKDGQKALNTCVSLEDIETLIKDVDKCFNQGVKR